MTASLGRVLPALSPGTRLLALGGTGAAIQHLRRQLEVVGPHLRSVLILEQPGMQALALAQALHELGPRPQKSVLELRSEDLAQFIRAHGAAALERLIAERHTATLFLPDAHQLRRPEQGALLHLLRERGSASRLQVVAASTSDLRLEAATHAFSGDLLQQLSAVHLRLPSMAERAPDLALLLQPALDAFAQEETRADGPPLTQRATQLIVARAERSSLFALELLLRHLTRLPLRAGDSLGAEDILPTLDVHLPLRDVAPPGTGPRLVSSPGRAPVEPSGDALPTLQQVIDAHLARTLAFCHGNKLRAAEILGISRSTLYRMLEQGKAEAEPSES